MIDSLVSVIIPTFNSSSYIKRTIHSVINQSYSNFEILIIDDFSDDFDILDKEVATFSDKRIHIHRLLSKHYAAGARNVGVKISKGEYIAYLDSDDEWFEDKLEKNIQTIRKYENQEIVIYSAAIVKLPHREIILPKKGILNNESIATYKLVKHGSIFTPTIFLKKVTALKINWNENLLKNHEDFAYCLELYKNGARFFFINEALIKVNWVERRENRKARGSWIYSYKFHHRYKDYFTENESKIFLSGNVIMRLLKESKYLLSCRLCYKHKLFKAILIRFAYVFQSKIFTGFNILLGTKK